MVPPALVLDDVFLEPPFADDHPVRDPDQFHVREHHAGTLVAVVEEELDAGVGQYTVDGVRGFAHRGVLAVADGNQRDVERRERVRKGDPLFVVVLLDRSAHDAGDADAVTAHFEEAAAPCLVEEAGFHSTGVTGAQLKDMADLDTAYDLERSLAVRAGIAGDDLAYVGDRGGLGAIPAEVDAGEVKSFLVGAADKIAHRGHRAVGDDADPRGYSHRTDIAGLAAQVLPDFRVACEAERIHAGDFLGLDLVQRVVPSKEQQGELAVVHDGNRFDRFSQRHAEQLGDVLTTGLAWSRNLSHGLRGGFS